MRIQRGRIPTEAEVGEARESVFLGKLRATLVATGAVWRYLDNGSDQGAAWRMPGFDDNGWTNGPSELGYGDGDEATVVSYGPDAGNKYPTTYFRRTIC